MSDPRVYRSPQFPFCSNLYVGFNCIVTVHCEPEVVIALYVINHW
jgi:hypothetical protein